MKRNNYFLIIFLSLTLFSCNNDEKVFKSYQNRIVNISTLSQSLKNTDNEYLKSLIDSSKIITNDINQLDIKLDLKKSLIDSIKIIESSIEDIFSQNCLKGKTLSLSLPLSLYKRDKEFEQIFSLKIICDVSKKNFCTINTEYFLLGKQVDKNSTSWDGIYWDWYYDDIKDQNIKNIVKKGIFETTYKQISKNLFEINIEKFPLKIKVNDLKNCECELIK